MPCGPWRAPVKQMSAVSQVVKSSVAWIGSRVPYPATGAPVILLYHGTPRKTVAGRVDEAALAEQIRFLTQHFELISPEDFKSNPNGGRSQVLLTFDDGFRNNYEVARPILRAYHAPALFFVSSRHAERGKYLWFAYLRALEDWFPEPTITFRGQTFPMRRENRRASVERLKNILLGLRPHPLAMYEAIEDELPALADFMTEERIADLCAGMSADQVRDLAEDRLFTVGCHTMDHPFLTRCAQDEMARQISENTTWIERATGQRVHAVAYPSGDYDSSVLEVCKRFRFERGYAVIPNRRPAGVYELPRIGIYGNSLDVLGCVVRWGNAMRAMRVPMG